MEYEHDKNEPFRIPIEDVLDLHSVSPRDIGPVVEEYLSEVHRLGFGVQRELVRKILERTSFVESFSDAPAEAGGWGATIVTLRVDPATIGPLCSEIGRAS